jgi:hypothetical protein
MSLAERLREDEAMTLSNKPLMLLAVANPGPFRESLESACLADNF